MDIVEKALEASAEASVGTSVETTVDRQTTMGQMANGQLASIKYRECKRQISVETSAGTCTTTTTWKVS